MLGHLIGDFALQPNNWVKNKQEKKIKSLYLYVHILIHFALLVMVLQADYWLAIIFITLSHYVIDVFKLYLTNKANERYMFVIDQVIHILILIGAAHYYYPQKFYSRTWFSDEFMLLSTFLVFVTYATSIIVKYLIAPWDKELGFENKSIEGAGKYIGILERLFVFSFVLLDTWSAIGFLITAKSVFRFGDLNEGKNRKLTEYVLIGTLLSFGFAILSGLSYNYLLPIISNT